MRWTFDANADAFYLYLSEDLPTSQIELEDGVIVDVDGSGTVTGIEVLGANRMVSLAGLIDMGVPEEVLMGIVALVGQPFPVFFGDGNSTTTRRESDVRTDSDAPESVGVLVELVA